MISKRKIYMNGKFVKESDAKISIFDSALMFGDMVFEMTRSFNKKHFKLKEHIERLFTGLKILRYDLSMTKEERKDEVKKTDLKHKQKKIGRNEPCYCGSGKKYKHCCGAL